MKLHSLVLALSLCALGSANVLAQSADDLLRICSTNDAVGSRAASLGSSFMGIADDASAAMLNPAGLSLLRRSELDLGLGMYRNTSDCGYLGSNNTSSSREIMPAFGALAGPMRAGSHKAGYSVLFNYDQSLKSSYAFSGFNPVSSIVPSMLSDIGTNITDNLLYQTYVADTSNGRLVSPVKDSVFQSGTVTQTGSRGSFMVGFGVELTPHLSFGLSLGSRSTSYTYSRNYSESDTKNKYNFYDTLVPRSNTDLSRLDVNDRLEQQSSAFELRMSLMGTIGDWGRLALSVSPPMSHRVHEDYSRAAAASFDYKPDSAFKYAYSYVNDYSLSSPWDLGIAGSVHVLGLTLAASLRYRDYSSASFDINPDYAAFFHTLNDSIAFQLQEQLEWSLGAEYHIPEFPLFLRASIDHIGSAYVQRIADASTTISAAGIGFTVDKQLRFDLSARFFSQSGNYAVYGDGSNATYSLSEKPSQYVLQCSYRF